MNIKKVKLLQFNGDPMLFIGNLLKRRYDAMTAHKKGLWAERLTKFFLRLKGYRILAHRQRTPFGEIDMIVRRRGTLAFVEVKHRPDEEKAFHALSPKQRQRLEQAARWFLAYGQPQRKRFFNSHEKKDLGFQVRFDIVLVIPYKLIHLTNAWMPEP